MSCNWKRLKFSVSISWNWLKWVKMGWSRLKLERIEIISTILHFYQLQPTLTNFNQFLSISINFNQLQFIISKQIPPQLTATNFNQLHPFTNPIYSRNKQTLVISSILWRTLWPILITFSREIITFIIQWPASVCIIVLPSQPPKKRFFDV